jgi:hypothetical protein
MLCTVNLWALCLHVRQRTSFISFGSYFPPLFPEATSVKFLLLSLTSRENGWWLAALVGGDASSSSSGISIIGSDVLEESSLSLSLSLSLYIYIYIYVYHCPYCTIIIFLQLSSVMDACKFVRVKMLDGYSW